MRIDLECEMGSAQVFILLTITGIELLNNLIDIDDYQETQRRLSAVRKNYVHKYYITYVILTYNIEM